MRRTVELGEVEEEEGGGTVRRRRGRREVEEELDSKAATHDGFFEKRSEDDMGLSHLKPHKWRSLYDLIFDENIFPLCMQDFLSLPLFLICYDIREEKK